MRAGVFLVPKSLPKVKNFTLFNAASPTVPRWSELDVLLTGGRLGRHSRAVIEAAFNDTLVARHDASALAVAKQLMVASPEFQPTGSQPGACTEQPDPR